MSTEDYKRGVEDATKQMNESDSMYNDPKYGRYSTIEFVNLFLENRKKTLLTKKVTKWTGVILSNYSGYPTLLDLLDSKEQVEHYFTISKPLSPPIELEIEVPL